VDERWLTTYRRWVYAGGWGLQLGAGVVTVMPAAAVWLVFALALLSGSATAGAILGATFGLTRGLTLLAPVGVVTPERLRRFHAAMAARSRTAHRLAVSADGLVAAAAVLTLAR
jgi:sulfite exporter TauE/SafE